MSDLDREYDEFGIADLAEYAIVTHSVTPLARKPCSETFAGRTWIVASIDVLVQPGHDDATHTGIELAELFVGPLGIEQPPHLEVFCCNLVGGQGLRVLVELALRTFPRDEIKFVLDA